MVNFETLLQRLSSVFYLLLHFDLEALRVLLGEAWSRCDEAPIGKLREAKEGKTDPMPDWGLLWTNVFVPPSFGVGILVSSEMILGGTGF